MTAVGLAILSSLCSTALADSGYINIEVVNDSSYDQRVAVTDNICGNLVLEKRIIADGRLPAQVCARDMGRGNVTIRNLETGSERQYQGILDGDRVQTP